MFQKKWVIGNWKMNGRIDRNQQLLNSLKTIDTDNVLVGIAPPVVYLSLCIEILADSELLSGAQDVSCFREDGAYTGEVSAQMLADAGARFALVGHSERRHYFLEDNNLLEKKLKSLAQTEITPILCVGENLQQREAGCANNVVAEQLKVLDAVTLKNLVVAYEPVWAIGTGKIPSIEQIAQMHQFILQQLLLKGGNTDNIRLLYGGSVNGKNAADICSIPNVNGALVGGASLKFESFMEIIEAARES